jgi:3-phenylpropionate/cinnamic acid dioxygenase small subunit
MTRSLEDRTADLLDKHAIRELLDEYCLRLEVNTFEEWLDLFTEDAVYEVYRKVLNGREDIAALLSKAPHGVHLGGAMRIALNGDTAETIQNYVFIGDDDSFSNNGWYYRTVVRTAAGWRIAHTRVKFQKRTRAEPSRAV